jgi:hypothetical protein
MDMVYTDKHRYEIQVQKVLLWYTGIYRPISSTVVYLMMLSVCETTENVMKRIH